MVEVTSQHAPAGCPTWCALHHGRHHRENDQVHASGALMVRHTVLRLWLKHDPATGVQDGPYVLLGTEEYSLHEADALVDALTQLVDRAAEVTPRAGA